MAPDSTMSSPSPVRSPWLATVLPTGALFALALLSFAPALTHGYVEQFDDGLYLVHNPQLDGWRGLVRIWTREDPTYFNPLVFTTFWIERQIGLAVLLIRPGDPPHPTLNHAVNVLLHAAAGALFWQCLRRLGLSAGVAWVAAVLWMVHPLQAQSVAWATERKNTLSGAFGLAATLLWLQSGGRGPAYWGSFACFVGAMLSKAAFLALPVVWFLLPLVQRRPLRIADLARLAPFAAVAVAAAWITLNTAHATSGELPPLLWRCALAAQSLTFYLWKLVWPFGLTAIYERWHPPVSAFGWIAMFVWAGVGVAWVVAFASPRARRSAVAGPVLIAGAAFVLLLAPVLGFVPFGHPSLSQVLNHHAYLAIAGPVTLIVAGAAAWVPRRIAQAAAVAATTLLAMGTFERSRTWRDTPTLVDDVLRHVPNSAAAHEMLGAHLLSMDSDRALAPLQRAVDLAPNLAETRTLLGVALARCGRGDEALEQFQHALRLDPHNHDARWQISRVYAARGDWPQASHWIESLPPVARDRPTILDEWARAYAEQGMHERALEIARRGMVLAPHDDRFYVRVGWLQLRLNRPADALDTARQGAAALPGSAAILVLRGHCRLALGDRATAESDFLEAQMLDPPAAARAMRAFAPLFGDGASP